MTLQRFKYALLLLFVFNLSNAQEWVDIMRHPDADFREAQKAFERDWANREYEKGNGYKQFKRWENFIVPRMDENGRYDPTQAWNRFSRYRQNLGRNMRVAGSWTPVGPFTPPGDHNANGIGRIDCIAFHPQDSSTYWVGAPSGGLWKTTTNGADWTTSSDDWEGLGISDIVIAPTNSNIMYVSTGDRDHYAVHSFGVLKSTDGGNTWSPSGLSSLSRIFKLLVDPQNEDIVIAATCCGVYRTTDGGVNWNVMSGIPAHQIFDIAFKPGDSQVVYAVAHEAIYDHAAGQYNRSFGFYRSSDNGISFDELALPFPKDAINRAEIGVSPAAPDNVYLYCSDATTSNLYGLYKSTTSGTNFSQIASPTDKVVHPENPSLSLTIQQVILYQGWYDWTMNVNPNDENEIYLGAVGMIRTYDEGNTWEYVAGYTSGAGSIHTDFHAIEYHPITNRVFVGCDGGVWREPYSDYLWTSINTNLVTTQNYTLGSSLDGNNLLIGNQDNATYYYNGQEWDIVTGGDGMSCIIDPADPEILYTSSQQGFIYKIDHGQFETILTPFITDQYSRWETAFRMDPIFRNELYALYEDIWKTTDAGATWTNISKGNIDVPYGILDQLEIAETNSDYLYTADRYEAFRSTDGGATWNKLSRPWEMFEGIGDMELDPSNPDRLWVCTWAGRVFRTEDGGSTWVDLTGTLPNITANSIIYQKGGNEGLYLAMDVGVFYRDKTMSDWQPFYSELPNVVVTDLEIIYCTGMLRAATYGRGVWETALQDFDANSVCCNAEVASLTKEGETLICGEPSFMIASSPAPSGSTYQWYKDGKPIPDATQSSYEAVESGIYAVRFMNETCSSTASNPLSLTLLPNGVCTQTCSDINPNTPDGPGNTTVVQITESLYMPDPNEQIWICVSTNGDFGTQEELMNIYDESNALLGQTMFGRDCSGLSPETCFYISIDDFTTWMGDGQVTVTLDPISDQIGLFCEENEICVGLRYSTPSNANCSGDLEVPFTRNNTYYKAGNALIATATIPSDQTVVFTGGEQVDLEEGFDAIYGSDFDAYIAECSNLLPPEMIYPNANDFVDNGCTNSLDAKEWYFEWTEVDDAAAYHLLVYAPNELSPIINKQGIAATRFTYSDFDYVEDKNTNQWRALVRAQVNQQWTNWSSIHPFSVESLNTDCQNATSRSGNEGKSPLPTLNKEVQLKVHPNPATSYVNINYFLNKVIAFDIQLYDITGQRIQEIKPLKSSSPGEHSIQLNTSQLTTGMYYIVLENKDFTISEKLVIIE